jgi:hypothetical protein
MKPFLPAIKSRPHVFREPDLWTLEEKLFVRTSPNGQRLELPITSLSEIKIWRSTPIHEGVVNIAGHVMAKVRFGKTWYRLYGSYPRGIYGMENQSGAVSAMIFALINAAQVNREMVIRTGSRSERISAQVSFAVLIILPAACFLTLPLILWGEKSVSFGQVLVLSILAMVATWALCWWKLGPMITQLNAAGKQTDLTPAQYLANPPY